MSHRTTLTYGLAVVAALLHTPSARSSDAPAAPVEYIYYDYPDDNGQLRGGRIVADPDNPHHFPNPPHDPLPEGTWNYETIFTTGPSQNRIDLVLLGDGYTDVELDIYAVNALAVYDGFFGPAGRQPFRAYRNFFNVHRVDVISPESGVDEPDLGIFVDTALDMYYNCAGIERLLCIDVYKALVAAGSAPASEQVLALANSTRYGGAGYSGQNLGTLAGRNSAAIEIALHEFGHAFGDLADEYDYGGPTNWPGGEPGEANLTTFTADELLENEHKWYRWLDVPSVDTFEGGGYSVFGVYRPTFNSLMRNLGRPFEQVNEEQLVMNIYRLVNPIDDATPPSPPDVDYDQDTVFFVNTVNPEPNTLSIQWSVDGVPIPGATGTTFSLALLELDIGLHDVHVDVVDTTARVRDEAFRQAWMSDSRQWVAAFNCVRPSIVAQPQSAQFCNGGPLALSVDATGESLNYQWRHYGADIEGATEPTFSIASATSADAGPYSVVVFNECGPRESETATMTMVPSVIVQAAPADQTVCTGQSVFFFVSATGGPQLVYQWHKDGMPIGGATRPFYAFAEAVPDDAGQYSVHVANACGTVVAGPASLTVDEPPAIDTQPQSVEVCENDPAVLTVVAHGGALTYTWHKDGIAVPGTNSPEYTIDSVGTDDAGAYSVRVDNHCGQVLSTQAWLTITDVGCAVPGDVDADGDVDLFDVAMLHDCLTGPAAGPPGPECTSADLDGDGDVDLIDFGRLQADFPG